MYTNISGTLRYGIYKSQNINIMEWRILFWGFDIDIEQNEQTEP